MTSDLAGRSVQNPRVCSFITLARSETNSPFASRDRREQTEQSHLPLRPPPLHPFFTVDPVARTGRFRNCPRIINFVHCLVNIPAGQPAKSQRRRREQTSLRINEDAVSLVFRRGNGRAEICTFPRPLFATARSLARALRNGPN